MLSEQVKMKKKKDNAKIKKSVQTPAFVIDGGRYREYYTRGHFI